MHEQPSRVVPIVSVFLCAGTCVRFQCARKHSASLMLGETHEERCIWHVIWGTSFVMDAVLIRMGGFGWRNLLRAARGYPRDSRSHNVLPTSTILYAKHLSLVRGSAQREHARASTNDPVHGADQRTTRRPTMEKSAGELDCQNMFHAG